MNAFGDEPGTLIIPSGSEEISPVRQQIGEAVAEQYAAEDVIFDAAPVAGHGTGFAVTSEGVKTYVEGEIAALTIPEELDDLQDVELTSPTAGQILEYDDNDGKWKNVANPASTTNFGAPYDESTTYNVPSLVIENNLLFKLNEGEVDVTGPFDPTKWTQTSLAELTAEDFPLSSTDPTPTSEAIGDLSTLSTSDKSSVVGAVNEVNGEVNLKQNKATLRTDNFLVQNFQSSEITIPANGALNVTANTLNYTIPTGYTPIAVAGWYTGSNDTFARSIEITAQGGQSFCVLRNVGSAAFTGNFQFKILFIKT